jgi:preprotein translocase subunit SecD
MANYIKYIAIFALIAGFAGCAKDDTETSKTSFQILADKEKELNDREARMKLKEIELEERERKLGLVENPSSQNTTQTTVTDTASVQQLTQHQKDSVNTVEKQKKQEKKKEIQKEITKKFENPTATVKDYYEYIQRGINEEGNFESNMKKAHKYFPSRPVDKLKSGYRNTKQFTIVEEPKVLTQKEGKADAGCKKRRQGYRSYKNTDSNL